MHATTVAIDLAKSVFQLVVADEHWHIVYTQRLTRRYHLPCVIDRTMLAGPCRPTTGGRQNEANNCVNSRTQWAEV